MALKERLSQVEAIEGNGFPIADAVALAQNIVDLEYGNDKVAALTALFQAARRQGIRQGRNSMRNDALLAIKEIPKD